MPDEIIVLTPVVAPATEAPLPADLVDATVAYMERARAENTRAAYDRAWARFTAWCERHGRSALPANPATVATFLTALADGRDGAQPLSRSSINLHLAAMTRAHRKAGHGFDRRHPIIADTWSGITRKKAKTEIERQAQPIVAEDLRELLGDLRPEALTGDARDAALLCLGWAAALRRSELVGLDWQEIGQGSGVLRINERGLVVKLAQSKGSQDKAVEVVVPRAEVEDLCAAVAQWVATARLAPGEPVFRAIDKAQRIGAERLTERSVSRIVKARVRAMQITRGKTEAEADKLVELFSGHSMRAGYATAAAANNVPSYRIQQHTRHRSAEMVARYVREADKWTKSGLQGVWNPKG